MGHVVYVKYLFVKRRIILAQARIDYHGIYNNWGKVRINVTMRSVQVTIVAVEKKQVLHILGVCL